MLTHTLILALLTQFAAIEGQVRDARSYAAIPAAKVELWQGETPIDQTYTDDFGRFHFGHIAGGRFRISAAYSGYDSSFVEIDAAVAARPVIVELARTRTPVTNGQPVVSLREYLLPDGARKEFERARKEAKRQNCPSAIGHFENGLRTFDQDASAHNDLGNCYRQLGRLELAADAFKRAHALSDSVYIALNLAEVFTAQKRFKEAESLLLEAIRKQPETGDAYYGLALVYIKQGLLDDAEAAALQAEAHRHQLADVHVVLADLYLRKQKSAEVNAQLQLYLKEAPNGQLSGRVREVLQGAR